MALRELVLPAEFSRAHTSRAESTREGDRVTSIDTHTHATPDTDCYVVVHNFIRYSGYTIGRVFLPL